MESLKSSARTEIFYEAPHRILETLGDIVEVLGESRPVVVSRELTKLHEEFLRGPAAEVLEKLKARQTVKGEITLLIGKAESEGAHVSADAACPEQSQRVRRSVRQRVAELMAEEKIDEKAALKKVAKERGISKSEAYRQLQRSI